MTKEEAVEKAKILKYLIELNKVSKILSSFIPVFLDKTIEKADKHYLYGFFNLGGTVSGRLSSNSPNMQNLPSTGSIYAKPIKKCFKPPKGWLLVGADFASLEDRISALTTKDPNKLNVYLQGFDGHCLRSAFYFKNQMPDIDLTSVESVNSIQDKYKKLRQLSKAPTFLLTYGGSYIGLMNNCGFSEEEAKSIEAAYHDLYQVSDTWVQDRLKKASIDGYITAAFGLRVRTPILHQILYGKKMPYEAAAEGRTAGNALGQSWGLLNNRAQNEFLSRAYQAGYKHDIHPVAAIHDAQYYLIRNTPEIVKFTNDNLIECMEWQDHPDIYHPEVKLGGELEIYYPSWADPIGLPNKASIEEIEDVLLAINICESDK
jgi:DNA polymerase-1